MISTIITMIGRQYLWPGIRFKAAFYVHLVLLNTDMNPRLALLLEILRYFMLFMLTMLVFCLLKFQLQIILCAVELAQYVLAPCEHAWLGPSLEL